MIGAVATHAATGFAGVTRAWRSIGFFLSNAVATFSSALMVSLILHVLVVFGVSHPAVNPKLFENQSPPLDVVLVNAKSKEPPLKADVWAQADLNGGGVVDLDRHAQTPLPASDRKSSMGAPEQQASARVQALEAQTQALLHQIKSQYKVPEGKPAQPQEPRPSDAKPAPLDLSAHSLEMAELQARIDTQMDEYQKRPRKLFPGATAKKYTFAQYVDDWRQKVERVGNLNYPEAARRNHLYGSLTLEACIRPDGSLYEEGDNPAIVKSSGSKILDAAAIKIVRISAPFSVFPSEMRGHMKQMNMDLFCIVRTWSFTHSDQVTSQ